MDKVYHITIFDNFHRGDWPDECWEMGRYSTAEEAIALVKEMVDQELKHFWSEICRADRGRATLDDLISHYNSFAEAPVAFDSLGTQIFDTTAYMKSRAAEMITQADGQHGPQGTP